MPCGALPLVSVKRGRGGEGKRGTWNHAFYSLAIAEPIHNAVFKIRIRAAIQIFRIGYLARVAMCPTHTRMGREGEGRDGKGKEGKVREWKGYVLLSEMGNFV